MSTSDKEGLHNGKVDTASTTNNLEIQEPKKGNSRSWSKDEHIAFLDGLHALGKNDWKGMHTKFLPSRTPAQIASHAQKYFKRVSANKINQQQRTSIFDIPHPHLHSKRTTSVSQPLSQVSGPEIDQQRVSSSKKTARLIPAICWISKDDYSNGSIDIEGYVLEPLPALPTTHNNAKSLREMVLRNTNCDTNLKTVPPESDTNCDIIKN